MLLKVSRVNRDLINTAAVLVCLWIFFKSVPFFFGLHSYYTWEAKNVSLVLTDGTELTGTIRFENIERTLYSVDIGDSRIIIPKDSVRSMAIPVQIKSEEENR